MSLPEKCPLCGAKPDKQSPLPECMEVKTSIKHKNLRVFIQKTLKEVCTGTSGRNQYTPREIISGTPNLEIINLG